MNDITKLLNLEDENIEIIRIEVNNSTMEKYVYVKTSPRARYCPVCGFRMHSRGTYKRYIQHPMLQDGYLVIIVLSQRRWRCINEHCKFEANEGFNFVSQRRRFSNASDYLIVEAMRDLSKSATSVGKDFKTSAQHVIDIFDKYILMERLPLSEAISVDEVHLEMDVRCKYVMVLQDFVTGNPIDMLISRRSEYTEPYFSSIPIAERAKVKYLISDMYNPYLEYVGKYFPNAMSIVDSFHVTQWINNSIINYIRELIRDLRSEIKGINDSLKSEGKKIYEIKNALRIHSDKLYLLQHYRWLVTKNLKDIDYSSKPYYDRHFRYMTTTEACEEKLFEYYPKLKKLRTYKERYITFNSSNSGNVEKASTELDDLIDFYQHTDEKMFKDFAALLSKYREPILNSFTMMTRIDSKGISYESRLSNGPIESLNRKAKDLKRLCRGLRNFDHLRNRFLFATRKEPVWDGREKKHESK